MTNTQNHITVEYTAIRSALLKGHDQTLDVIVRIKGPKKPIQHKRKGVNLSLVLDRSGSMQGDPLREAKKCITFVLDRLEPQDQVSLITYDDRVDVLCPSEPLKNKQRVLNALETIEARGSTNLFAGWQAGKEQLETSKQMYDFNRVILLSDGQLNAGITDASTIQRHCSDAYEQGISTSTYGIGKYFNEHIMTLMAEVGKGNAYYGETAQDLMDPFTQELDLFSYLYAQKMQVKIRTAMGVQFTCMNQFNQNHHGYYQIPDLPFEAENWIGLRLTIPKDLDTSIEHLLSIELIAQTLGDQPETIEQHAHFEMLPFMNAAAFEVINKVVEVEKYFAELQVSQWQKEASRYARQGNWDQVEILINKMERLDLDEWGQAQLKEMKELLKQKDQELFSKEMLYHSHAASQSYKTDISDYNQHFGTQEQREEAEASRMSFLRRKVRRGKSAHIKK